MGSAASFGRLLRRHRLAAGLSLRSLGAASNVSISTLSAIENGKSLPRGATLRAICLVLDLDPDVNERDVERIRSTYDGRYAGSSRGTAGVYTVIQRAEQPTNGDLDGLDARLAQGISAYGLADEQATEKYGDDLETAALTLLRRSGTDRLRRARLALLLKNCRRQLPHRLDLVRAHAQLADGLQQWAEAAEDYEYILMNATDDAPATAADILHSGVQLLILGQYNDAGRRLAPLVTGADVQHVVPQVQDERDALRLESLSFAAWIWDYKGRIGRVERVSEHLLKSPHVREDGLRYGGVLHRLGRSRVEAGLRLKRTSAKGQAGSLIETGQRLLAVSKKHIDAADRANGRDENPFGELWRMRAAVAQEAGSSRRLVDERRAELADRPELLVHVDLVATQHRNDLKEASSSRELEQLHERITHCAATRNIRSASELLFEYGEALRLRGGDRALTAGCFAIAHVLAEELGTPLMLSTAKGLALARLDSRLAIETQARELATRQNWSALWDRVAAPWRPQLSTNSER